MTKARESTVIDMKRYVDSEPIVDQCEGCNKVFDFEWAPEEGEILVQEKKCLAYTRPEVWWRERPVALLTTLVQSKTNPKGILENLPARDFRCPLATHIKVADHAAVKKVRAGQQKQKKKKDRQS